MLTAHRMSIVHVMTVLCLILPSVAGGSGDNSTSIRDRIPTMLKILCPGSDVCRTNISDTTLSENSCCAGCSCDPECKKKNNCCFPSDYYPSHDNVTRFSEDVNHESGNEGRGRNNEQRQLTPFSECLFPFSNQPVAAKEKIQSVALWMISANEDEFETQNVTQCGEEKVAPWGNIWPVTSNRTGTIYKNAACAKAHNVTDAIIWTAVLICDIYDHSLQFQRDSFNFANDDFPDYCSIQFNYPHERPVSRSDICYNDLIDKCLVNDFQIPVGIERNDIIEGCTSGLVSPFRNSDMYANVFCHICSGEKFYTEMKCQISQQFQALGSIGRYGFRALVQPTLSKNWVFDRESDDRGVKACIDEQGHPKSSLKIRDRCKPLLCPSGQLRDIGGKCIQLMSSWLQTHLRLNIKLLSDQPFSLSQTFPGRSGVVTSIPNIESPWPEQWYIFSIFYKENESDTDTNELLISLIRKLSKNNPRKNNPKTLLKIIQRLIRKPWQLKMKNATLTFKSDFWELRRVDPITVSSQIENITIADYRLLYMSLSVPPLNVVSITKLYFCEQVPLKESEFKLGTASLFIFNKITGRFLLNAQFSLRSIDGRNEALVCIEDSGFKKVNSVVSVSGRNLSFGRAYIPIVLLLAVVKGYMV